MSTHRRVSPDSYTNPAVNEKGFDRYEATTEQGVTSEVALDADHSLHRGLQARHISMIAIGGAIGTGLIIGTGSALANAGPGSIFIAYLLVGFIVFLTMAALGEMAAWNPMPSGFTGYASRYCSPSLGFALGWTYLGKYLIIVPNQLTAAALVISYWVPRDTLNPGVFIAIFLILIVAINMFGIKFFGEFEFWLSSFKVITILGLILLSLILALGGGPNHDRTGFRYWKDPGAFRPRYLEGSAGQFLGFCSTLVTAVFAYLGTELVGVTVAEAQNPRRTVPRAIKLTFYRILVFYVLSVFLVGMLVPWNSSKLATANKAATGANASPFVVAIKISGIRYLDHIINACILVFVFSAANSDLYISSRTLYSLACDGSAPRIFSRTNKHGTPYMALAVGAVFALIAFLNVAESSQVVFGYFVNLVSILGLLAWISILVTHIYFVRARRAQGISNSQMPFVAPLGLAGSFGALALCILIAFIKNYTVFIHNHAKGGYGDFDYKNFITGYLGIPLYLILIFGHKFWYKTRAPKPHETDLYGGKDIVDREEEAFLAHKAQEEALRGPPTGLRLVYKYCFSWLF
ncbi:amino acid permease [Myriangium duriaei CBS 260.36]|uniref:Amino acid permease n=1 Tax=Myriangium duriaei CBS 260.36 TaxID=1168546 RepID=A0A9P4MJ98_9PEZI|nr:amino acid permease [Myriangium duriaei CBS 260.36]